MRKYKTAYATDVIMLGGDTNVSPDSWVPPDIIPLVTILPIRYAQDQIGVLTEFLTNVNTAPSSYGIGSYKTVSVTDAQLTENLELDIFSAEFGQVEGQTYYATQSAFYSILEIANANTVDMEAIAASSNNAILTYSTDNLEDVTFDAAYLASNVFNLNGAWYIAIRRNTFFNPVPDKTEITLSLTLGGVLYAEGTLSEYISVIDTSPPLSEGETADIIKDFDLAIIRYKWNESDGGDLDTRTQVTSPARVASVGWAVGAEDAPYLKWGGDNRAAGVESVILDLKQLIADNPNHEGIFEIALRAFWYAAVSLGNITLELETYKGGVITDDGFNFINVGGEIVETLQVPHQIFLRRNYNIPGQTIGFIRHDKVNNKTYLIKSEVVYAPLTIHITNYNELQVTSDTQQQYRVILPDDSVPEFGYAAPHDSLLTSSKIYMGSLRKADNDYMYEGEIVRIQNVLPDSPIIEIVLNFPPKAINVTSWEFVNWDTGVQFRMVYENPYGRYDGELWRANTSFTSANVFDVATKVAVDDGNNVLLDTSIVEGGVYYYMVVIDLHKLDPNGNPMYSFSSAVLWVSAAPQDVAMALTTVSYANQTLLLPIRGTMQNAQPGQSVAISVDSFVRPQGDPAPVYNVTLGANGAFTLTENQSYEIIANDPVGAGSTVCQLSAMARAIIGNLDIAQGSGYLPSKALRRVLIGSYVVQLIKIKYLNGIFWGFGYGNIVIKSTNGANWTFVFSAGTFGYSASSDYFDRIFYGNGAYVITGPTSTDCAVSTDGITWTYRRNNMPIRKAFKFLAGKFFGVALEWKTDIMDTATAYTNAVKPAGTAYNYSFTDMFEFNGYIFAWSWYGLIRSTDGANWTDCGFQDSQVSRVLLVNNKIYVKNSAGWKVSSDGVNYTTYSFGATTATLINNIMYGNGKYLAVGNSGTVLKSSDGVNWTVDTVVTSVTTGVNLSNDYQVDGCVFMDGYFYISHSSKVLKRSADLVTWETVVTTVLLANVNNIFARNGVLILTTQVESPAKTVLYVNLPGLT